MEKLIKITPDLNIGFNDLMHPVDINHEFTLLDVLRATVNSQEIPVIIMKRMLHCRNLEAYYKEAASKPFTPEGTELDYLELYWEGNADRIDKSGKDGENRNYSSMWGFHGIGKMGVVSDDFPIDPALKSTYREHYAVELSPLYTLSGYKIKISQEMSFNDWNEKDPNKSVFKVKFCPSITLFEVLYWVMWELSFFGTPQTRDEEMNVLKGRLDEYKEAKENGTLDKIYTSFKDVDEMMKVLTAKWEEEETEEDEEDEETKKGDEPNKDDKK